MKTMGIMSISAVFLLCGIAAPANARQEKPNAQEEKAKPHEEAKPENKQEQTKAPKEERAAPEKKQEEAKAPKQEQAKPERQKEANAPKREQEAKPEKQQQVRQQEQAKPEKQHETRQQQVRYAAAPQRSQEDVRRQHEQPALRLSARGSGRIPDERYRANFGSEHHFHIGNPVLVGGYSRFQYGGFWFGFAEPWPASWYYTDDVYIEYADGGYYMYDPYYPGERFAISVVI